MALVLAATAATAGYIAYKKHKQANLTFAGTTLDDKESITLLPGIEDDVSMFEMPLSTITWYNGNHEQAALHVKQRLREILQANPWLAGWLVLEKGKLKVYYATGGNIDMSRHFLATEPGDVLIDKATPYDKLVPTLLEAGALVENNMELIGHDKTLFKVAIIPSSNASDNRFALVVSMSHALGDPHTYYRVLGMLDRATHIESLVAVRNETYPDALLEKVGKEEYSYLMKALDATTTIDTQKQEKAIEADQKSSSTDPMVNKIFILNQDWLTKMHAEEDSFSITNVPVPDTSDTTFAAHAVLASWFFKLQDATVAMLPYNQRFGRLAAQGCLLDDKMAGNYTHTVLYTPKDYRNPGNIQLSMAIPEANEGSNGTVEATAATSEVGCKPGVSVWRILKRAPKLDKDAKVSIISPFAVAQPLTEISLSSNARQEQHMMLLNVEFLRQVMAPGGMSVLQTFTAVAHSNSRNAKARAGVFIMCQQSVWDEHIANSGIVDEFIFD